MHKYEDIHSAMINISQKGIKDKACQTESVILCRLLNALIFKYNHICIL